MVDIESIYLFYTKIKELNLHLHLAYYNIATSIIILCIVTLNNTPVQLSNSCTSNNDTALQLSQPSINSNTSQCRCCIKAQAAKKSITAASTNSKASTKAAQGSSHEQASVTQ